jgi:hypothetical protein
MDIILTELYDVIQESVENETGKTVFSLGSCWLHILHDDFRDGCNAAKYNIEDSFSCLRCLFMDAPARREDFTKVKGVHNFALGFLGNVSVAERAPSVSPNLQMYVHAIKAKKKLSGPAKKQFKEFECILQGKLITARLNFFILISREVGPLLKIYQTEKPMTAFMCYDLSSLIRCLM